MYMYLCRAWLALIYGYADIESELNTQPACVLYLWLTQMKSELILSLLPSPSAPFFALYNRISISYSGTSGKGYDHHSATRKATVCPLRAVLIWRRCCK